MSEIERESAGSGQQPGADVGDDGDVPADPLLGDIDPAGLDLGDVGGGAGEAGLAGGEGDLGAGGDVAGDFGGLRENDEPGGV